MNLNAKVRESINQSMLCWLATISSSGIPNVTPKQIFTHHEGLVLIAHIASANSVANIQNNPAVCVSMIEVFRERGFKLVGEATYADQGTSDYDRYATILREIVGPDFPILGVIVVNVRHIEPILSPSYRVFPKRTDAERIALVMQEYGVQPQESS